MRIDLCYIAMLGMLLTNDGDLIRFDSIRLGENPYMLAHERGRKQASKQLPSPEGYQFCTTDLVS